MPPAGPANILRATMRDGDSLPLRPSAATMNPAPPVPCPECRSPFAPDALGPHLRQAHKYQFFQGVWRSPLNAAHDALAALAGPRPDPAAWKVLAAAAGDLHGPRATFFLAA